jgi:hypothetical protein
MSDASALARSFIVWLVPFALVIAAIGIETDWGRSFNRDAPAPVATSPQPVAVALLPEYRIDGGIEARRETVERVLFNPTRRPAPPASQTAGGASAMKKGQYTLTGTTVVGNVATAVLREVNGGKSRSVHQGDKLGDGLLVAEVRPDRVRLKQGDDVEELSLKIAAGPKTTVQPAPVAAAAQGAAQPGAAGAGAVVNPGAAALAGAGGSARNANRPVAPPPAQPAATTPRAGGNVSVSELLAERRRAARAAAEAAANGGAQVAPGPQR